MTSFITYLSAKADQLSLFVGRLLLRSLVLVLAAMAVVAMAQALGTDPHLTSTPTPAPADAPLSPECTPTAGELFNPCATLDASTVDYLYDDPKSVCLRTGGVVATDTGECVPSAFLWRGEVEDSVWVQLLAQGYMWSVDETNAGREALRIPAAMLVLDKDTVVGVRL